MPRPSQRFQHAFQTALAATIALSIALYMDWDKPYWAAWTVFGASLATRGEGVRKALSRLAGGVCGAAAGFLLLGLFIQERWLFVTCLSLYAAVTTYVGLGTARYSYFWQQAGFFAAVVAFDSAFEPANAFGVGVERFQETATGLLVYTIVGLLVWPRDSQADLEEAARKLASVLHQILQDLALRLRGEPSGPDAARLRDQAIQLQTKLGVLLDAAEVDSWKVGEARAAWRRFEAELQELGSALERAREGLEDLRALDVARLAPTWPALVAELEGRLAQVERVLAGGAPAGLCPPVEVALDESVLRAQGAFDQATLIVNRERLERLERTTRALLASASEIGGFEPPAVPVASIPAPRSPIVLDPDRFGEGVRVAVSVWLMFLVIVYVPDVPNSLGAMGIATRLVMADAGMATISVLSLLPPVLLGLFCALPFYVLVMPQLSGFAELGVALFVVAFAIDYGLHDPRQSLWRTLLAYLLLSQIGVTNEQGYDFVHFAISGAMWLLIVLVLTVTEYVPVSHQPDRVFLRMVARHLRSCELLLTTLAWDPGGAPGRLAAWRRRFHVHEIASLPRKLTAWARMIPPAALGHSTQTQLQELVTSLEGLGRRLLELLEARGAVETGPLEQALLADIRAWRLSVQQELQGLLERPEAAHPAPLRSRLDREIDRIEARTRQAVEGAGVASLAGDELERMYRLLGAHRGVSEALVDVVGRAEGLDWRHLAEARF